MTRLWERDQRLAVKLGMKNYTILALAGSGLLLAGCATTTGASTQRGIDQVNNGIGGALQAPLEDLNLVRAEIPEVLLEAVAAPYTVQGLGRCNAIKAQIARLDEALGPDIDAPSAQTSVGDKAADAAADATLDAVRDTVTDFIPGRSWVRRLSGAHRHSQAVQKAVQAGLQRRAFLKGVGLQKRCGPPAAPAVTDAA
jgi:hypothetical protein